MGLIEWGKMTLKRRSSRSRPQSAMAGAYTNVHSPEESSANNTPQRKSSTFLDISQTRVGTARSSSSQLDETMNIFRKLKRSRSLKALQLPQIPHLKPMTMTSLLGEEAGSLAEGNAPSKGPIARKPVPQRPHSMSATYTTQRFAPRFDPREPLEDPNKHLAARVALKKRYQSKLTVEFEVPRGLSVRDYDFRWVDAAELDRKVLDDIIWVRERYAQIGKAEPSDEEIIWWYDAEASDEGSGVGIAL